MARAELAKRHFDGDDGVIPEIMINVYPQPLSKGGESGAAYKITHMPRGLIITSTAFAGMCRGLWHAPNDNEFDMLGVFGYSNASCALYTIDNNAVATSTGGVVAADSGRMVRFAASGTEIMVLSGAKMHLWNGTSLSLVTDSDAPTTTRDIAFLGGRFLAVPLTSPRKVFYSALNDGTSWTAIGYFEPEGAVKCLAINDYTVYVFCEAHIELWSVTSNPDSPYQKQNGADIGLGIIETSDEQSCVVADGAVFAVTKDCAVYRIEGSSARRISEPWLVKRLDELRQTYGTIPILQTFSFDDETWVTLCCRFDEYWYNVGLDEWYSYETGLTNPEVQRFIVFPQNAHRAGPGVSRSGQRISGLYHASMTSGSTDLYRIGRDTFLYADGSTPVVRQFSASVPLDRGGVPIDVVALTATPGRITTSVDPIVVMEPSLDGGQSFGTGLSRSFGTSTNYDEPILWQGLGMAGPPGLVLKFTTSAQAAFDVTVVRINEGTPF